MSTEPYGQTYNKRGRWFLEEDLDGCYIYPTGFPPDDYVFRRVKPVAKITDNSEQGLLFVQYLSKLPAFRSGKDRDLSKAGKLQREHEIQSLRATVRCPDHRNGGTTRCPRGGAELQIWQRKQWGD